MADTQCLVCLNNSLHIVKIDDENDIGGRHDHMFSTDVDDGSKTVGKELQTMFILRQFLGIPQDIYCEFLQEYGDPCFSINCCDSCSNVIIEAKRIFDEITILQNKYEKLQERFKTAVILSVKCQSKKDVDYPNGVNKKVRSYIFEEQVDPGAASHYSKKSDKNNQPEFSIESSTRNLGKRNYPHDPVTENFEEPDYNSHDPNSENDDSDYAPESSTECYEEAYYSEPKDSKVDEGAEVTKDGLDDKKMSSEENLQRHLKSHDDSIGHTCKCEVCGKTFAIRPYFKKHAALRSKASFKCDFCEKSFFKYDELNIHLKTCHKDATPFICEICGDCFISTYDLNSHVKLHLQDLEPPFTCKCEICHKRFKSSEFLETHAGIHKREKPFKCSICSKDFFYNPSLREHMVSHTGEN